MEFVLVFGSFYGIALFYAKLLYFICFILWNWNAVWCWHYAYERLTIFNSLWFRTVLQAFYRHLNIILVHFYWLLLLESVLQFPASCLAFCLNQLFEFYWDSSDWLSRDKGSGCGESRNRLQTVLYIDFCFFY